ncbi:protein D2-like [Planococcus citri]|uniref:protein D2-like n=1 Tax=Planococcus citri TaxID=170843 RepID=UPI0031F8C5FE
MIEIKTGETVYANVTKKEPVVKWPVREGKFYALFMGGLAPIYDLAWERGWDESLGDQVDQQWENWVVVNIPGSGRKVDFGEELVSYYHLPVPYKNTTDRISFWIWEQPEKFENPKYDRGIENRNRFGDRYMIQTFTKQFRLGDPWAGDFFVLSPFPQS